MYSMTGPNDMSELEHRRVEAECNAELTVMALWPLVPGSGDTATLLDIPSVQVLTVTVASAGDLLGPLVGPPYVSRQL